MRSIEDTLFCSRLLNIASLSSRLIPPALLTYFFFAWKACLVDITPYIANSVHPVAGYAYAGISTFLIGSIAILYLRLYLLPSNQSVPPFNPPAEIREKRVIFECLSPEEASLVGCLSNLDQYAELHAYDHDSGYNVRERGGEPRVMVNRCWKGKCQGRWKPARARHCSDCGVCRAGFDHHCPFFANCLTVPHIPVFFLVVVLTPFTVLFLTTPIIVPLFHRAIAAYRYACSDEKLKWWWDGWLSWFIFFGPSGRYGGAALLGWRALDRLDEQIGGAGIVKLRNGVFVGLGYMLSAVSAGLAHTAYSLVSANELTIDRERQSSHANTVLAIRALHSGPDWALDPSIQAEPGSIPPHLQAALKRWSSKRYFYVPLPEYGQGAGEIVETGEYDHVYRLGQTKNWEMIMGRGRGWILPWEALKRGMGEEIYIWPLSDEVKKRLRDDARRQREARGD